jgi:hypothetical protein
LFAAPPTVETIAAHQWDLITTEQLLATGLSASAITKRVARGALVRRHRGVYSLGPAPLSREARWLAAVLGAGEGSALSHDSAAELHVVSPRSARLIAVVSPLRRRLEGVRVHTVRSLDRRDITTVRGIPVTTVHRTVVDLADEKSAHEVANVIHEAAHKGRFVEAAVRDSMRRANGRHNLDVVDRAIALYKDGSAGTKSRGEVAFLLRLSGFPEPLVNTHVERIEVDFHWPDLKLVLEIDGGGHGRPSTRREDALKERILRAAGYEVLRFGDEDDPERIVAAISARRPTPSSSSSSPPG